MLTCHFCKTELRDVRGDAFAVREVHCPQCGIFHATQKSWDNIERMSIDGPTVSGWIREQNAVGITPHFEGSDINRIETLRKPGLKERAERYIIAAADRCATLQMDFKPTQKDLIGISYSHDEKEVSILVKYLTQEGWLEQRGPEAYRVTPKGHITADELRTRRAKSSQAFVAMWFTPDLKPIYDNALRVGIANAGYSPMRVDQKEHANKIDDEVIAEIRRSAFVIADFTGHRGGVYFEAGFAMGLGLPVIWTCRKDHLEELHFDIRQYNCLDWEVPGDFSIRLQQRIEAMFGRGPLTAHHQVEASAASRIHR